MRRPFLVTLFSLLSFFALTFLFLGRARADASSAAAARRFVVDLYTVGPMTAFPSRFGHSLLCVRRADKDNAESGTCYDYGVAERDDVAFIAWTAGRGVPSFMPVTVPEAAAVAFFRNQGRQVERQRIPLSFDEAARLVSAMDDEILGRTSYAYHPYWANCATRLRDHLDAATNGRLRKGPSVVPQGTFRDYLEEGHSGHLEVLFPMALFVGEGNDRAPTPWEAMFLPAILRDGVAERFASTPEKLSDRVDYVMPTSRIIGRLAVVLLGVVLLAVVRLTARRKRLALGLKIVGGTFTLLAISVVVVSALVAWREVSHNWALLLFLPTDLALAFLDRRRLALYLKARLATAGVLAALEIAGVVQQPVLPLALLVALPFSALLSALRESAASAAAAEPAGAAASVSTST